MEQVATTSNGPGRPYELPQIWDKLNWVYDLCLDSYKGSMRKYGYLAAEITRALRKRGVLWYNGVKRRPEWKWAASMPPTKELARTVLKDMRALREKERMSRGKTHTNKPCAISPSTAIVNELVDKPLDILSRFDDMVLVNALRDRGYTVTCTKTITL